MNTLCCPMCGVDRDKKPKRPVLSFKLLPQSFLSRLTGRHGIIQVFCPWCR